MYLAHLYRISQEFIQNAIKHSHAENGYFQFIGEDGKRINMHYEDDGIGFDYDNRNKKGLGVRNINNRIEVMNGSLQIESSANGKGTLDVHRYSIVIRNLLN